MNRGSDVISCFVADFLFCFGDFLATHDNDTFFICHNREDLNILRVDRAFLYV